MKSLKQRNSKEIIDRSAKQRFMVSTNYVFGVHGNRGIKVGHSNFHTIFKNYF